MTVESFARDMDEFENALHRIANDLTTGAISEGLAPEEVWTRSESSVGSLRNLANQIMNVMLVLKPEKAPAIEKTYEAVANPLDAYKEVLFRSSQDPASSTRLAIGHLKKSISAGSEFLRLAKDIEKHPSEVIADILRLKEVHDAKDYISAVHVPEAVHARFLVLKKHLENLRSQMSNLEKNLEKIRTQIGIVEEEIKKSSPLPTAKEEKKENPEEDKPAQ